MRNMNNVCTTRFMTMDARGESVEWGEGQEPYYPHYPQRQIMWRNPKMLSRGTVCPMALR